VGPALGPGILPRLRQHGFAPEVVEIEETMSVGAQWSLFQQMLRHFEPGDALSIDMTHGFRAIPIVISSAIHFLRLARGVELRHVYYAVHDATPPEIVDYRDFYAIGAWTEAVGRLVDDADARGLAKLAGTPGALQMDGLGAPEVASGLADLTNAIRDVDAQHVADIARRAFAALDGADANATGAAAVLLDMVRDKFATLVPPEPVSGRYDSDYFRVQLAMVRLLLEHKLHMQAFTLLRECVCSLGLHVAAGAPAGDLREVKKARGTRERADVFGAMVRIPEGDWKFAGKASEWKAQLYPWYERLVQADAIEPLRSAAKEIQDLRNSFDHAWTTRRYDTANIPDRGQALLRAVEDAVAVADRLGNGQDGMREMP
jgi:hypothetical protein